LCVVFETFGILSLFTVRCPSEANGQNGEILTPCFPVKKQLSELTRAGTGTGIGTGTDCGRRTESGAPGRKGTGTGAGSGGETGARSRLRGGQTGPAAGALPKGPGHKCEGSNCEPGASQPLFQALGSPAISMRSFEFHGIFLGGGRGGLGSLVGLPLGVICTALPARRASPRTPSCPKPHQIPPPCGAAWGKTSLWSGSFFLQIRSQIQSTRVHARSAHCHTFRIRIHFSVSLVPSPQLDPPGSSPQCLKFKFECGRHLMHCHHCDAFSALGFPPDPVDFCDGRWPLHDTR